MTTTTPDPFAAAPPADEPRPRDTVRRDRYGRPFIIPPDGGRPVTYTRCTTFVGPLEDTYNLSKWQQRMVAVGLARRPDLLLSAQAHADDKDELNKITEQALEAAGAGAAAVTGTALHRFTDRLDSGAMLLDEAPAAVRPLLELYRETTAHLRPVLIERMTVRDDLKVAGTPDRVVELEGVRYIADLKTGSIDYGIAKIAMQLGMYANSKLYNHETGERTDLEVDLEVGLIVHLPAAVPPGEQPTCRIVPVDIAKGWAAVDLARQVREHRADKAWTTSMPSAGLAGDLLASLIAAAPTADAVRALWPVHHASFTPRHLELAKMRLTALEAVRA